MHIKIKHYKQNSGWGQIVIAMDYEGIAAPTKGTFKNSEGKINNSIWTKTEHIDHRKRNANGPQLWKRCSTLLMTRKIQIQT